MRDGHPDFLKPYSKQLAEIQTGPGTAVLEVSDDWRQGRTIFGGLQASIALAAMRTLVPQVPLRTLQGTFFAPPPGGTLRARATVQRQGKNATHVEARLVDGDATLALLVGVFGTARASAVAILPRQEEVTSPRPLVIPFIPGVTPAFTRHFAARYLRGQPPYTGDTALEHVIGIDMKDPAPASEAHVLAIADYIAPIALSHLKKPAFGGTLTWMIETCIDDVGALALSGWRVDARLATARDGYTSQSVMVWGPAGVPVAMSRQSMVVFG